MKRRDQKDILKIIDETGLLSQIQTMTLIDFRKSLEEKGYCSLYDLVTISLLVYGFLTGKGQMVVEETTENLTGSTAILMVKYGLTKDEIETLKKVATGMTNQGIADQLGSISIEGVKKRIEKILGKFGVDNRIQASVKAAKEGII